MRPSVLGNDWSHNPKSAAKYIVGTRDEAVEAYGEWLWAEVLANNPVIMAVLAEITPQTNLVCCCKPARCHGDKVVVVVVRCWDEGRLPDRRIV
jgi:hypothetical protein